MALGMGDWKQKPSSTYGGSGGYGPEVQNAINAAKKAIEDKKKQEEEAAQSDANGGKFPGHPANAASVSSDYLISYDARGRQLDSLGHPAYGSFSIKEGEPGSKGYPGGGGGAAGAAGAGGASTLAAGNNWSVPYAGGGAPNWQQYLQYMSQGPGATPWLTQARSPYDYSAYANNAAYSGAPPMTPGDAGNLTGPVTATPLPAGTQPPYQASATSTPPPTPPQPGVPGMPDWTQPGYAGGTNPTLKDDQFQRMLAAAAGIYFPYMNYQQGAYQFQKNFDEQALNNQWSRGFQQQTSDRARR